jgi:hypothetical protein
MDLNEEGRKQQRRMRIATQAISGLPLLTGRRLLQYW